MNRREFTRSIAGGAAALPSSAQVPPGPAIKESDIPFKISVMLGGILFIDRPFEERLERMAEAGYGAVELGREYRNWNDQDFRSANIKKRSLHLEFDAVGGLGMGFADPKNMDGFLATLTDHLSIADKLECRTIITTSGSRIEGLSHETQHEACVETLKRAGDIVAKHGLRLVVETIDLEEDPTCFLTSVAEDFEIIRKVDNPHLQVLCDFYHEQIAEGNLIEKIEKNIDYLGLVHIADVPGRREPGTGEINYVNIFRKLAQLNYSHYAAMEYRPTGDFIHSLRSTREMVIRSASI